MSTGEGKPFPVGFRNSQTMLTVGHQVASLNRATAPEAWTFTATLQRTRPTLSDVAAKSGRHSDTGFSAFVFVILRFLFADPASSFC